MRGQVAPGGARAPGRSGERPEDGLEKETVVPGGAAGVAGLAGTEGRDPGPHVIGEDGSVGIHGPDSWVCSCRMMPPFLACCWGLE